MAEAKPISRMNKSELEELAAKEGIEVPDGASKSELYDAIRDSESTEAPDSEVPPTSGPEDVQSSAMFGGEGSVDPETGETKPRTEDYTGDVVEPAETLADGGPEPPQPRGGDEPERPLEQTAAPGFKSEGAVAAAEVTAKNAAKAAKQRAKEQKAAAAAMPERKAGISVSHPRALNTQITITGEHFPPRKSVRVALSGSRFPTGEAVTTLRANDDGLVQAIIYPSAGEQSVSMTADGASAEASFTVADPAR